jgi:hypothetical protein
MRRILILIFVAGCHRSPEPFVADASAKDYLGRPMPPPAGAVAPWSPAPPAHPGKDGDLQDLACKHAVALGCPQPDTCAMQLRAKSEDPIFKEHVKSTLVAKTREEVAFSAALPCDVPWEEREVVGLPGDEDRIRDAGIPPRVKAKMLVEGGAP